MGDDHVRDPPRCPYAFVAATKTTLLAVPASGPAVSEVSPCGGGGGGALDLPQASATKREPTSMARRARLVPESYLAFCHRCNAPPAACSARRGHLVRLSGTRDQRAAESAFARARGRTPRSHGSCAPPRNSRRKWPSAGPRDWRGDCDVRPTSEAEHLRDLASHWRLRLRRSLGEVEIREAPEPHPDLLIEIDDDLPTAEYYAAILDHDFPE